MKWQRYNDAADAAFWVIMIVIAGFALAYLCFGVYRPGHL